MADLTHRKNHERNVLIEQLKKTPIIQIACEKVGVARATYYRWYKRYPSFKKAVDIAMAEGKLLINDMAESQLLTAIRDKNLTAIIYWLKHHHPDYKTRVEFSGDVTTSRKLTKIEQDMIQKALGHAGLFTPLSSHPNSHEKSQ